MHVDVILKLTNGTKPCNPLRGLQHVPAPGNSRAFIWAAGRDVPPVRRRFTEDPLDPLSESFLPLALVLQIIQNALER
jgi:hypothetical protein